MPIGPDSADLLEPLEEHIQAGCRLCSVIHEVRKKRDPTASILYVPLLFHWDRTLSNDHTLQFSEEMGEQERPDSVIL